MKYFRTSAIIGVLQVFCAVFIFSQSTEGPVFDLKIFKERQIKLAEKFSDGIIVMKSGTVYPRNNDVDYDFRQSSNYYYLTGFTEPLSAIIIDPKSSKPYTLFVQPRDPLFETWTGKLTGTDDAVKVYGADASYDIKMFDEALKKYISEGRKIYFPFSDNSIKETIQNAGEENKMTDIEPVIGEMRLYKSDYEIEIMQKAIDITCDGLIASMKASKPGMYEYQLQAVLEYTFHNEGSVRNGFPSIVGSGPNSTTLHYETNRRIMENGDMVLMDVGAEYGYYSADVTRTFPVNGKFSPTQKRIYNIVLAAQKEGIEFIKPGVRFYQVDSVARQVVKKGLIALGFITESDNTFGFFMHPASHWLGLDVHDAGSYNEKENTSGKRDNRILQPGMVLTVEPGIYIAEGTSGVDPEYYNIGVRIEDDVLVTQDGYNLLSGKAPKEVNDIERVMSEGR